jgi:hypothetical protein
MSTFSALTLCTSTTISNPTTVTHHGTNSAFLSLKGGSHFIDYLPADIDFYWLELPGTDTYCVDRDFAGGVWWTARLLSRIITIAAYSNCLDLSQPLPKDLPNNALEEIGMLPPPVLPVHISTHDNPLVTPSSRETLIHVVTQLQAYVNKGQEWVEQTNSMGLARQILPQPPPHPFQ